MKNISIVLVCGATLLALSLDTPGQQINVASPFNSTGSSFFESFGTNFGFSLPAGSGNGSRVVGLAPGGILTPNVSFSQNGANTAIPSFGGFDPNAGATFGFSRLSRNGGGFSLGLRLAQGSSRTSVATTPSLTLPNGGFGTISDGALRPFVTGVTPVVGIDNGVTRGIASGKLRPYDPARTQHYRERRVSEESTPVVRVSSANTGAPSLADITLQKQAAAVAEKQAIESLMQNAQIAAESGDRTGARLELLKALRRTGDAQLKRQIKDWMKRLRDR